MGMAYEDLTSERSVASNNSCVIVVCSSRFSADAQTINDGSARSKV